MQAIRTRYHGPTNVKGSRISATCERGRIYVGYDHALNLFENHATAAALLVEQMGWGENDYIGGCFDHDYYWAPHVAMKGHASGNDAYHDTRAYNYTARNEIARSEKKVDRKTAAEVEALRSALGNIEQALGLGHLRTDGGAA